MFLRRVAAACPRSKRMFISSVSHGFESAIQELNKEMESVFGEPPMGGLASSASNNHANNQPQLSSQNIGETSFELTHTGNSGEAQMVDVSPKESSKRTAIASGKVILGKKVFDLVLANQMAKGDVLAVAKIAGITAAKQTSNLIPLCHNIGLSHVQVDLKLNHEDFSVTIEGEAASTGKTGVEMEALTAVSIAGLTVYDMCKAASKDIAITDIRLKHKSGGKSGDYEYTNRKASIVAKCDRKRVLSSWIPYCCNMIPEEFQVEFSSVRHLSPRQFVEKLSKELKVHGVVAGENHRFGYKAAGDALELVKLCEEYGIEAYIIKSVMDKSRCSTNINSSSNSKERGQVSSTRVREALAVGDMRYVSELLGRQHRLVLMATEQDRFSIDQYKVSAPKSCLLNLAPKEGLYEKCSLLLGQENVLQCRVIIDSKFVHIETNYGGQSDIFGIQNLQFLHIEFGDPSI